MSLRLWGGLFGAWVLSVLLMACASSRVAPRPPDMDAGDAGPDALPDASDMRVALDGADPDADMGIYDGAVDADGGDAGLETHDAAVDASDLDAAACPPGYAASDGACVDIDECAGGTDDCDGVHGTCSNTVGAFACACAEGFAGTAHGADGCLWDDPSLATLTFGSGATLSPAFSPAATTYTVTLAPGSMSTTVTPTVAEPDHMTVAVDGNAVASSATVALTFAGFAPRALDVVVTTESGATRRYTLVVIRQSLYVKASNTDPADWFGYSVSLSADGTRLAVGAWNEASNAIGVGGDQTDNTESWSGAVYVFVRSGGAWTQEAYLKSAHSGQARFGWAVSLSADGSRLGVSAIEDYSIATGIDSVWSDYAVWSGAAYVFFRSATTWTQEAYIKASNTGEYDQFGWSLSLSGDGTRLAVGAIGESGSATGIGGDQADNAASWSGAAYVFARSGATWTQEGYVKASNTGEADEFGRSVSLSADGATLAVGARHEDSVASGVGGDQSDDSATDSGAVYVFSRSGATWTQDAYLKASNTGTGDEFGYAIALSADGERLAVGAITEDSSARGVGGDQSDDSATYSGAVYVFSRSGPRWIQEAYVKASNADAYDVFGWALSLSTDGTRLVVGAIGEGSGAMGIDGDQAANGAPDSGAVYVFSRAGATWTQNAYLKASNTEAADQFGVSVSLSGDGAQLAVGASSEESSATGIDGDQTNNNAEMSGAVYLY